MNERRIREGDDLGHVKGLLSGLGNKLRLEILTIRCTNMWSATPFSHSGHYEIGEIRFLEDLKPETSTDVVLEGRGLKLRSVLNQYTVTSGWIRKEIKRKGRARGIRHLSEAK